MPITVSSFVAPAGKMRGALPCGAISTPYFWPICLDFIITKHIKCLCHISHGVFVTHNNPNETLSPGNILLRACCRR